MGRDFVEIASLLIGVALVALLVSQASGAAKLIGAGTQGFNTLLQTVTLQGGGFGAGSIGGFNNY